MNRLPPLLSALALAAGLAGTAQAQQQFNPSYPLTDYTTWTRFGSATAESFTPGNGFTYSNLRLTQPGVGDQAGAGFAPQALNIDFSQAFSANFNFFIPVSTDLRGDGLTFVLTSTPGVGSGGSGLGYEGLGPSVAFAIDTFHFGPVPDTGLGGEPESPSLQILRDGSVSPLAVTETHLGDAIRDPDFQWGASVLWTPSGAGDGTGTFAGTISHLNLGSFTVSTTLDLSDLAGQPLYAGFTASNGAATDGHFVTSAMPVPEPGTWALMLADLGVTLRLARRPRFEGMGSAGPARA